LTTTRHFESFTSARTNLRSVLDAARQGVVTTIVRDGERFVVVNAADLRGDLANLCPAKAVVSAEGGGWSAVLPDLPGRPGLPVAGEGDTFDQAIDDLVEALREYAEDWNARLYRATNHRSHRTVVELVELSSDEQLRDWILGRDAGDGTTALAYA